jgi:uncharacterized protein (DUF302 family)
MKPGMYGFAVEAGSNFDEALNLVVEGLKKEGFGIITDIDFQAIAKTKLNVDEPRYRILGACNPSLAHQALRVDPDIGLLLPCNVVVREDREGRVTVAFTAPEAVMALVNRKELSVLAEEIRRRFERIREMIAVHRFSRQL